MIQTGVSLVQPCIPSRRSTNDNTTRTTDIARLRCHRLCSNPIPARGSIRHGGIRCLLKTIYFIEVMTPMWSADGWAVHYEHILSKVPRHMFLESDLDSRDVSRPPQRQASNRPSTGLLHADYHLGRTIDVSNHSHVRVGKAGALVDSVGDQHLRQYRNKGAAGVAPGKCIYGSTRRRVRCGGRCVWSTSRRRLSAVVESRAIVGIGCRGGRVVRVACLALGADHDGDAKGVRTLRGT